ncbi:MAG TPA: hypothetical protein VNO23_08965 [Candidatus Binatia bacterium]|nr:hypothetical protein [Candidatus Binatia bacterium]
MATKRLVVGLAVGLVAVAAGAAAAASPEDLERRMEQLQREMQELREQLEAEKKARRPATPLAPPTGAPATPEGAEPSEPTYRSLLDAVKIGGYGSVRFESNTLDRGSDTFTFRRFVLTTDARIARPLRFGLELELERFTELELERKTAPRAGGGLESTEAIEGSAETEISLEQAWLEWELARWLRYRAGMLLVPLGRFNLAHDDNRWNLPRRPLIDRGVPVLPVPSAWSEVGMGFTGEVDLGGPGTLSYHLYVVNGVTLDTELERRVETRAGDTGKLEVEAELRPTRGTAGLDLKNGKAVTGRLAWSPLPGQEIGASFYVGRYTPEFLAGELLTGFGVDGLFTLGPFEVEAEYLHTRFANVRRVARSLARVALEKSREGEVDDLETEVEFDLAGLAETKHGYWIELRYRLFPDWLRRSFLGRAFDRPQLVPTLRWEQAWLDGRVRAVDFTGGALTGFEQEDRTVNRITAGLAYRPLPLVVFQLAYEYTWTDRGKSLAEVTNFLPAQRKERDVGAFLVGVAFGF